MPYLLALHQHSSSLISTLFLQDKKAYMEKTYKGVGFPKVFLKSPLTAFCGLKYNFSNTSGLILRLCTRSSGAPCPLA
jgi:hypothetical protein